MDIRLRASPEQFSIMLDFMENYGDLSRPQAGAQGRLRAEQRWTELTELLNSMGGSVQKPTDKWKRVWSDWKTKTKKKVSLINRDTRGTGGGPKKARPLNPFEERVLKIIGLGCITGQEELHEAGIEISLIPVSSEHNIVSLPSLSQPIQPSPSHAELWPVPEAGEVQEVPISQTPEPVNKPQPHRSAPVNRRQYEDDMGSLSAGPSTPRRRRVIGPRRRRHQTPFEQAAEEFVKIEEARLKLDETRILKQHEREMEQLKVESQRISMEENRNQIFQRIADIGNNLMEFLLQSQNSRD